MCLNGRPTRPLSEETDNMYDEQMAAFVELFTVAMASADDELCTRSLDHHLCDDMFDK